MTTTRFADLLTALVGAPSIEEGLARTLRRVVTLTGAAAGAVVFSPPHAKPIAATAGPRTLTRDPSGRRVVQIPLGASTRPVGRLTLVGRGRALKRAALPPGFGRELGTAIEQVWQRQRRTLRTTVLTEITRLLGSSDSLDDVLSAFANGLARLVDFDAVAVSLLDAERGEFEVLDVTARTVPGRIARDVRLPLEHTLLERVVASGGPVRVDDLAAASVPAASRATLGARGWRSAALVPLVTQGGVFGAVSLVAARPGAFDDDDVESAAELAQPLASAIEQRRLVDESRRRAEELAALYSTSQLITARLDVASVLDRISRAVTALIPSTGCGIGLLDPGRMRLVHAAAHGFRSDEWRALAMPVGEGIIGQCAETGTALRVDDVRTDPRSTRHDVDEREGIRSMLCVPLRVAGTLLGVISAFSTRTAAFTMDDQRVLEAFAEQAGIAVQNAQLFEESLKRTRETRALFEAGRAVTASLDLERTIRVILEQARSVLGALADQAAIAIEHARLYEGLEAMVAERTRELDRQKRFVEVVLETLPLGVFVLDPDLRIVRANREGVRTLGCDPAAHVPFAKVVAAERAADVEAFLRRAFVAHEVARCEEQMVIAGETKQFRLTTAPLRDGDDGAHLVLLVEDITLAKQLERQMLLTERLTTAGRLAAGVAAEPNHPLATIAGCAESLRARPKEDAPAGRPELTEFPTYPGLAQ